MIRHHRHTEKQTNRKNQLTQKGKVNIRRNILAIQNTSIQETRSAVADKPRDAFVQYATAWLTHINPPCREAALLNPIFQPTSMMSQFQDEKLAKLMQTCDVKQVY